jgi:PPM family protein phosphatase
MGKSLSVQMSGHTDAGQVRDSNEDAILWDAEAGWALLADGMGGHMAGEVASHLAVETLESHLGAIGSNGKGSELERLREAVQEANRRIHAQAGADVRCHNMGTTVVAALFRDATLTCAHVGDSRLYRYSGGELEQISHDHSLVQELVDEGMLSSEEAAESSHKNVITRALGLEATVEADLLQVPLHAGELYLLCSDGLSDMIPNAELTALLQGDKLDDMAHKLVAEANRRGGTDNISVILVRIK